MCSVMLAWSSPHCFEAVGGYPRQVESTLISSGWIPTMVELTLLLKQWVCSPPGKVEPFVDRPSAKLVPSSCPVESTLISSGWIPTLVELTLLLKQWVSSPPGQVEPFVLTLAVTNAQSWFLRPGVCIAVCVVEPTLL